MKRLIWAAVRYLHALKPQPQSLYLGKCIFPRLSRQQNMLLHHSLLDELLFILLERLCCALLSQNDTTTQVNHYSFSILFQEIGMGSRGNAPDYIVIEKQYHSDELLPVRDPEPCYCTL